MNTVILNAENHGSGNAKDQFKLEVPPIWIYNYCMMNKKIINEQGFKIAVKESKTWTTLDCQLNECEDGSWYFEISKHVFNSDTDSCEQLAYGEDDDNLTVIGKIWENFIKKYNPDECFVDQHSYVDLA